MNDEKILTDIRKFIGYDTPYTQKKALADYLFEHYQPKLPKDSVVLSKEEYEKLKNQANIECDIENIREAVFDITSCVIGYESAERLYKKCFPNNTEQLIKENRPSYNDGYFDGSKETAEQIFSELFYIASIHHSDIANILTWAKEKVKQLDINIKR